MSKETRLWVSSLAMPLIVALAGWITAHSKSVEQQREKLELSDDFQSYVEYVMQQRGCEP